MYSFSVFLISERRSVSFATSVPTKLTNTTDFDDVLVECKKLTDKGCNVIVFPEGTRSLNGEVGRFKRGAFQIAIDLGLPVIPLSLSGCYEVLPKGKPFVHRNPVHMHVGEPIDLKQFNDPNEAIEAVRNAVIAGIKS